MKPELCKNCVRWARNRRRTPAFTESHQRASCSGKLLNRLRNEVFQCRLVMLDEIAFQACSFNHSDISPSLESTICGFSHGALDGIGGSFNRAAIVLYGVAFHTYRNVPSLAVATVRPRFRVARFNADLTFSLPAVNCANGTLSATPSCI